MNFVIDFSPRILISWHSNSRYAHSLSFSQQTPEHPKRIIYVKIIDVYMYPQLSLKAKTKEIIALSTRATAIP